MMSTPISKLCANLLKKWYKLQCKTHYELSWTGWRCGGRICRNKFATDFVDVFKRFKEEFSIKKVTIQTGGTLNAEFLRLGLIDKISVVIALCLIGGEKTQSLVGGESLHNQDDLLKIKALKLIESKTLKNSYLHLTYKVLNDTKIEN